MDNSGSTLLFSGKIKFPGLNTRLAEYVCVKNNDDVKRLIEFMLDKQKWNLRKPQLMLSVTGGTRTFSMPTRMKKAFKRGLVKAAESTDALIITSGFSSGVSKLVGEAVAESSYSSRLVVIGLLSLSVVAFHEKLQHDSLRPNDRNYVMYGLERSYKDARTVLLDSNHTHFILVDDNANGQLGCEISYRVKLETGLRKDILSKHIENGQHVPGSTGSNRKHFEETMSIGSDGGKILSLEEQADEKFSIPMILICVNGGYDALKQVCESVKQRVPVLILAESKGAADLIINGINTYGTEDFNMGKIIEDSKILERRKSLPNYDQIYQDVYNRLFYVISPKNRGLMNIFRLEDEEDSQDIELAILRAFLNSQNNNHYENLKLSLQWNRIDIAKSDIFTGDEHLHPDQLGKLLEIALIENKPEFVKLLIENGTNLDNFLTYGRIYYLYNSKKIRLEAKREPLFEIFKKHYDLDDVTLITFERIRQHLKDFVTDEINFDFLPPDLHFCLYESEETVMSIKTFLDQTYETGEDAHLMIEDEGNLSHVMDHLVEYPNQNIFIWAILLNRIELAIIFWQMSHYQIGNALLASILLNKMASELSMKSLVGASNEFDDLATGVLNLFDAMMDEKHVYDKLLRKIPMFGVNCLELASLGERQAFLASPCVQNHLTRVWDGKIVNKEDVKGRTRLILSAMSLGILAPFLVFDHKIIEKRSRESLLSLTEEDSNVNIVKLSADRSRFDKKSRRKSGVWRKRLTKPRELLKLYLHRYISFLNSPCIIFMYETLAFLSFLILFSFFILCEFNYYYDQDYYEALTETIKHEFNLTVNQTEEIDLMVIKKNHIKAPSLIEYVLVFWVATFILEEFRQLFIENIHLDLKKQFAHYFRDKWNYVDILGCSLFCVAISIRAYSYFNHSEVLFKLARVILCVDLCMWYIRLLHVFTFFRSLGPKLVMIKRMIKDLVFFLAIVAVFLCAFGITTEATLNKASQPSVNLFKQIINKAYWPIFGTIKVLDDFDSIDFSCTDGKDCPEMLGVIYSYVMLMVYVIIGNVLLINLLIAMFSSTFARIQENADLIWKFQRYKLVYEYVDAPILPAPLCFLSYIYSTAVLLRQLFHKNKPEDAAKLLANSQVITFEDFERRYAEEYLETKSAKKKDTTEEKLRLNTEKLELLEQKLNKLIESKT